MRSLEKPCKKFCHLAVGQNFMPKKIKLKVQKCYTSFLLWKDNNSLSSNSLYKDFTAQSLVEKNNFYPRKLFRKISIVANDWAPTKLLNPELRMLKDFSKGQKTHTKEIIANRHFVFFQLKAVRKPWWNHKPLPFVFTKHFFHAIESFYRPLVMSNRSFIITETFRWLIFYNVNYRR